MHTWSIRKLKTVLLRVQAVVRGHPLSAVCCPSPLRCPACSFSPSRQKALFSAGWPQTCTITPKHFMLQKSQSCTRAPGGLVKRRVPCPPMKHLPHTCRELSQSRESGQFVDSCLPRREVLIISWGWCEVVPVSLRTINLLIPPLYSISLSLCLTGQSKRLWGGCLPMSRQVLNIWCVPSGIGSLLMAVFNIRPPRSKAWHSLWTYPINNVPPQTKINTHTDTN